MPRKLITAAAQMGPIAKSETCADAVKRLLKMRREAKARGSELVIAGRSRRHNLEKTNA